MGKGDNYGVCKKYLKQAEFELLVLKVPENEIEDKLTQLSGERGVIQRSLYEDFLIAVCVANVNQLLYHLNQRSPSAEELLNIRKEIINHIIDANPLLNPTKLIINSNHVVKIKTGRKKKGEKLLTENKDWGNSYYDFLKDVENSLDSKINLSEAKDKNEVKNIENLEYKLQKKWWKRIQKYVEVKVFLPEDVENILKQRFFHNRSSFETYIVSVCVKDYEDLFEMLDGLGIPKNVAPPILMHELYELCLAVNKFLNYDTAKKLSSSNIKNDGNNCNTNNPISNKASKSGTMGQFGKEQAPKKLFRDVPKEDILRLGDNMKVFLIGQDEAVDTVSDAVQRASVGLKDPNKPLGSFLFAGRTGVGKTLATKVLADELIKEVKDNIITIDCSEYTADHEYSKLIGAPSGYVGHENGGMLTNAILENQFRVVVFDEIEKANYKVHQLLLQILEEGRLTDGKGRSVSFNNAVVVMTSNVGVSEMEAVQKTIGFGEVNVLTEEKKDTALNEALKKKFKPEFLNRIDAIVNFRTLKRKDYIKIIGLELYKLSENMRTNDSQYKNIELNFDKKIKSYIYKKGIDKEYGARPLKRCIERKISTALARKLLSEDIEEDSVINITVKKRKVCFDIENRTRPPFYISKDYSEMVVGEGV